MHVHIVLYNCSECVLLDCRENLPGHFKFKEYCPRVFHNLRKRFGLDDVEYMASCSDILCSMLQFLSVHCFDIFH